ncbi:sodium:calcium antiporter [Spirosoma validum]|uniref:Sodium:calcium antiporter n=1 Tax=Spirosoma validum TaxID=2771355 RepID=A0A927B9E7_9BACT|nr:sodium:calcium antiporter [Spirosoma validum]MBD2757607.1 sodium:calcium antiporter [Spirosoma validum]
MLDSLSLPILLLIFSVAAAVVWRAGISLSDTTDILSKRFKLGEALGGIIVLAIVTNLPEIAITISASLTNKVELAVGNILGGIAMQTVVLALLDAVGIGKQATLSSRQSSLIPVLEGIVVIAMLTIVVMGHQLPVDLIVARMTPAGVLLIVVWMVGVWLTNKANKGLPWQLVQSTQPPKKNQSSSDQPSTTRSVLIFSIAALATLAGGVALEESGDAMSSKLGMNGVIFGATILAAATSLPEVSTGLAAVKLKDYTLAVSDIFGGNAFLPVLLALATMISGKPVLPTAQKSDIYLTGLGILVTVVYVYGFLFRPKRQIARMGIDSFVVLLLYLLGTAGLFMIARK